MENEKSFGKFLISKRQEKEISARQLAIALDYSAVYICDIEKDRRPVPDEILEKLPVLLHLSEEEKEEMYDLAARSRNTVSADRYYIFPFCPAASPFPSRYRNAMAGTRRIGTWVSCFAMPKSSSCLVMRKALVTFALSSLQSSTMASVAGIWELLRYFTSQRIFSRGNSMTTSTSF